MGIWDNAGKLKTTGNETTMNLNNVLYQNIIASPYFKTLYDKRQFDEIVDEIFYKVKSLEPFLKGTTASTAFCLLYKMWTLRLTVKQVYDLINHPDSPHIRGLGFMYLRYVGEPSELWEWFEEYLDDEEEIQIEAGVRNKTITIGKLCQDLLTEAKWLGTILPRIPVPIARELQSRIQNKSSKISKRYVEEKPVKQKGRYDDEDYDRGARNRGGESRDRYDLEYDRVPRNRGGGSRDQYDLDYDDPSDRRRSDGDYSRRDAPRSRSPRRYDYERRRGSVSPRRDRSRSPPRRSGYDRRDGRDRGPERRVDDRYRDRPRDRY
ncbi:PRP38 family-domain-containing protein [Chytridium lagenaria]|nr:PRP38 family-domain-containing protein [Chytridium lagenaria]